MDALASRIVEDFSAAFGRMPALKDGLHDVHGIEENANEARRRIPPLPALQQ
jgi:hypothetical protein